MDRHNLPGVTAKDVAEAHQQDLKIQHHFGCRGLTYWFDEVRQTAFCLIEAPDEQAVKRMHNQAHGLVPNQVIEVKMELIEAFLGRIEDAQTGDHPGTEVQGSDTGFRAIMAVLPSRKTEAQHAVVSRIRSLWQQYGGREVESRDDMYLASFASVIKAVACAAELHQLQHQLRDAFARQGQTFAIGLSTGVPVSGSKELFGDAVQLARRLCLACDTEQVMASASVRSFYRKEHKSETPALKILDAQEEEFLNQLMDVTESLWNDARLTMGELARKIGISKAQLYRKVVAVKGLSPLDFLKEFRLQKALSLLENRAGSVSEIAYESGFTSPSYFSKCFQKRFGVLPSKLAESA